MGWSDKYKKSINCNNPKGFSQKAHCAGKKKRENIMKVSDLKNEIRTIVNERSINKIAKEQQKNAADIEKALDFYKKNKNTDKAKAFIKVLKQLGDKKKALAKEMDIAVSSKLRNVGYAGPLESVNEISAKKGLEQVIKGNTKQVEGIKVSKEMAQAMLDWFNSSPYGRKYPKAKNARLHVSIGTMLAFGLDRYAKHKGAKEELKYLKTFKESVNEMDPYLKPTPKDDEEIDESINEGPSTEEKRIAMLAVRKQAKYRNVDLASAIQDQINALKELQRDVKRGKIKK